MGTAAVIRGIVCKKRPPLSLSAAPPEDFFVGELVVGRVGEFVVGMRVGELVVGSNVAIVGADVGNIGTTVDKFAFVIESEKK